METFRKFVGCFPLGLMVTVSSSSSAGERDHGKSVTCSALCHQRFLTWGNSSFLSGAPQTGSLSCSGLGLTRHCCSLEHWSLIQPLETVWDLLSWFWNDFKEIHLIHVKNMILQTVSRGSSRTMRVQSQNLPGLALPASLLPLENALRVSRATILNTVYLSQVYSWYKTIC